MRVIQRIFTGLTLAILAVASLSDAPAIALQPGDIVMQVQGTEQKMDLEPLSTYEGSFSLQNAGRLPFTAQITIHPMQASSQGNELNLTDQTAHTAISKWIELENDSILTQPGESVEVKYKITVPDDVPAGGQYAAFVLETLDSIDESATIRTISQIYVLVYGHVAGETREEGKMLSHSLPSLWLNIAPSANVQIENSGNIDFEIQESLTVYNFFSGKEVFGDNTAANGANQAKFTIMPDTTRTVTVNWESAPRLGVFRVVQRVNFLDQEYEFTQIMILIPTLLIILVVVFVVLAVLWIVLLFIKHKRKRAVL